MSAKGIFKPLCKRGHIRTKESVGRNGGCLICEETLRLERSYGIVPWQVEALKRSQNNLCAICGRKLTRPQIDHVHGTVKGVKSVRGLLCVNCNTLIGSAKDNPAILSNAIKYLANSQISTPVTVYIASFFADKDRVHGRADELRKMGVVVTGRWTTEAAGKNSTIKDFSDSYFEETAVLDVEDILAAKVFILTVPSTEDLKMLTKEQLGRGGRHFESGLFYASMLFNPQKEFLILGPRENVFHFLDGLGVASKYPAIKQFDTWEEVKEHLQGAK